MPSKVNQNSKIARKSIEETVNHRTIRFMNDKLSFSRIVLHLINSIVQAYFSQAIVAIIKHN